ncbi:MAG TPA: hypothetical protein VF789_18410 [Thermoanaerobaculia bacterium]
MSGEDDPAGLPTGVPTEDPELTDQEVWQREMVEFTRHMMERYRKQYLRNHRNPIHALNAYRLARLGKIDIPTWVLELFDQWAGALCGERPPKGAKAVADALGLGSKGGPSITKQAETQYRDLWIAERVLALRDSYPERDKLDIFLQVAEEFELSSERVAGIWSKLTRGVKY